MQIGNIFSLDLPLELCEIIFEYLDARDILNCCLVSKTWLNFCNTSCCRKVLLIIDEHFKIIELLKSTRKFVRIRLNNLNHDSMFDVLCHFESIVEEMEIENCAMKRDCDLNFKRLKCLTISSCSSDVLQKIFKNSCTKLKCLVLYRLYGPAFQHVLNFLKINDTLEEINFYLDETNNIFSRDISTDIKFKLKSLFISYKPNFDLPPKSVTNIEKFLKCQGSTLEIISLVNSANLGLLFRIWNDLKVIERLYFFSSDPIFDHEISALPELNKNSKLMDLELHALGPLSLKSNHLVMFLNAAINLRMLGVWNLKKEDVEYVAKNLGSLRLISCATMENDCQTFYNDLKSKIGINDKIQIRQYL